MVVEILHGTLYLIPNGFLELPGRLTDAVGCMRWLGIWNREFLILFLDHSGETVGFLKALFKYSPFESSGHQTSNASRAQRESGSRLTLWAVSTSVKKWLS
jgi:hypothetical protein